MKKRNNLDIFKDHNLLLNEYTYYLKKLRKCIKKSKPNYITRHDLYEMLGKIKEVMPNEELYYKVKEELINFINFSNVLIEDNSIVFVNINRLLKIDISSDRVKLIFLNENSYEVREYKLTKQGNYYINKTIYNIEVYNNISKINTVYDIKINREIKTYDKEGYQLFAYEEEKNHNYYINNITKEKKLKQPWPWENFTQKNYAWRTRDGKIIKKKIRTYLLKQMEENNREDYLIGETKLMTSKNIGLGGHYIWFDKKLYQMYLNKECDSDYIFNNKGKVYEKTKN